jgi:hypothetical protein
MENLINRAKNIVLQPKETWEVIKTEETSTSGILTTYVFPLALIPAIASFIGYGFIGFNVGFFGRTASLDWGIAQAVTTFATTFVGVIIRGGQGEMCYGYVAVKVLYLRVFPCISH